MIIIKKRLKKVGKMVDLQKLQILTQLIDNLHVISEKLEKFYSENNAEEFNKAKREITEIQKKISEILE